MEVVVVDVDVVFRRGSKMVIVVMVVVEEAEICFVVLEVVVVPSSNVVVVVVEIVVVTWCPLVVVLVEEEEVEVEVGGKARDCDWGVEAVGCDLNLSAILVTRLFQTVLSRAMASSSARHEWGGASMSRLPDFPMSHCTATAL